MGLEQGQSLLISCPQAHSACPGPSSEAALNPYLPGRARLGQGAGRLWQPVCLHLKVAATSYFISLMAANSWDGNGGGL